MRPHRKEGEMGTFLKVVGIIVLVIGIILR